MEVQKHLRFPFFFIAGQGHLSLIWDSSTGNRVQDVRSRTIFAEKIYAVSACKLSRFLTHSHTEAGRRVHARLLARLLAY